MCWYLTGNLEWWIFISFVYYSPGLYRWYCPLDLIWLGQGRGTMSRKKTPRHLRTSRSPQCLVPWPKSPSVMRVLKNGQTRSGAQRRSHKITQTHTQTGPILLPPPLMQEVKVLGMSVKTGKEGFSNMKPFWECTLCHCTTLTRYHFTIHWKEIEKNMPCLAVILFVCQATGCTIEGFLDSQMPQRKG